MSPHSKVADAGPGGSPETLLKIEDDGAGVRPHLDSEHRTYMDSLIPNGDEVVGLTLYLAGSFDPQVFLDGLHLRPIRFQRASDNSVTVMMHAKKAPLIFTPDRKIECDGLKFAVPGPKSISQLFDELLNAIEALPPATRTKWDLLTERTVDLGVNWTNSSNCGTEYDVPERIIQALAKAGVALRISVYASSEAVRKACRELNEESNTPLDSEKLRGDDSAH